ncbi:hypothetical protein BU15DRAFT_62887 [Melanogaster broomeanus]|nr:hypothetical protein BU15DRAFT_62887 [Melanogaster broomeanus]
MPWLKASTPPLHILADILAPKQTIAFADVKPVRALAPSESPCEPEPVSSLPHNATLPSESDSNYSSEDNSDHSSDASTYGSRNGESEEEHTLSAYGDLSFSEDVVAPPSQPLSTSGHASPLQPKSAPRPHLRLKVRRPPMPKRRLSFIHVGGPLHHSSEQERAKQWPGSPTPIENCRESTTNSGSSIEKLLDGLMPCSPSIRLSPPGSPVTGAIGLPQETSDSISSGGERRTLPRVAVKEALSWLWNKPSLHCRGTNLNQVAENGAPGFHLVSRFQSGMYRPRGAIIDVTIFEEERWLMFYYFNITRRSVNSECFGELPWAAGNETIDGRPLNVRNLLTQKGLLEGGHGLLVPIRHVKYGSEILTEIHPYAYGEVEPQSTLNTIHDGAHNMPILANRTKTAARSYKNLQRDPVNDWKQQALPEGIRKAALMYDIETVGVLTGKRTKQKQASGAPFSDIKDPTTAPLVTHALTSNFHRCMALNIGYMTGQVLMQSFTSSANIPLPVVYLSRGGSQTTTRRPEFKGADETKQNKQYTLEVGREKDGEKGKTSNKFDADKVPWTTSPSLCFLATSGLAKDGRMYGTSPASLFSTHVYLLKTLVDVSIVETDDVECAAHIELCHSYNCRKEGHVSRDCPKNTAGGGYGGSGLSSSSSQTCYRCGHMSRDCARVQCVITAPRSYAQFAETRPHQSGIALSLRDSSCFQCAWWDNLFLIVDYALVNPRIYRFICDVELYLSQVDNAWARTRQGGPAASVAAQLVRFQLHLQTTKPIQNSQSSPGLNLRRSSTTALKFFSIRKEI